MKVIWPIGPAVQKININSLNSITSTAGEKMNCRESTSGKDYRGTTSVTKSNHTCLNWTSAELDMCIENYKITFTGMYC